MVGRRRSSSAKPTMGDRLLLKSCAMPLAISAHGAQPLLLQHLPLGGLELGQRLLQLPVLRCSSASERWRSVMSLEAHHDASQRVALDHRRGSRSPPAGSCRPGGAKIWSLALPRAIRRARGAKIGVRSSGVACRRGRAAQDRPDTGLPGAAARRRRALRPPPDS
jgi:hypothetical protein